MATDPTSLDLAELSERADVSVRTIRYYIQQGLLPAPDTRGPGAHYGAEHLDRLVLTRRMQREHLPLAEIRRRLDALAPAELARLARLAATTTKPRTSAKDYIRGVLSEGGARFEARESTPASSPSPTRSQWERIGLAPDVELHVRRPLTREQNRQVERLLEAARDIFEEDAP